MAILFDCDKVLDNLTVCNNTSNKDAFCFDKKKDSEMTIKLLDLFYQKHYNFNLSDGGHLIMASGGMKDFPSQNTLLWELGTKAKHEFNGNPHHVMGGTGPLYMLKCQKTPDNSSCMFWKRGSTPRPGSETQPNSEYVYELNHGSCLERVVKNNTISGAIEVVEESHDCEKLPLFNKFINTYVPHPLESESSILNDKHLYLQIGLGMAAATCAYKTYKEVCKLFQNKSTIQSDHSISSHNDTWNLYGETATQGKSQQIYELKRDGAQRSQP